MDWRSIPVVGKRIDDWILWFNTKRSLRKLHKEHDPQIEAAEKSKKEDDIGFAYSASFNARDTVLEPLWRRNSAKAVMKAENLGIPVPRYTKENTSDWQQSMTNGGLYLTDDAYKKLRREIREEQRSNYDEYRQWVTLILAAAGFALALVSLLAKQKQPDPCARNYYRNDAGACVLALTPPPQGQAPQTKAPNISTKSAQKKNVKRSES